MYVCICMTLHEYTLINLLIVMNSCSHILVYNNRHYVTLTVTHVHKQTPMCTITILIYTDICIYMCTCTHKYMCTWMHNIHLYTCVCI